MKRYKRLSLEEREEISRKLVLGLSLRQIAKDLSRNVSTLSRELKRFQSRTVYRAHSGQKNSNIKARSRRHGKRKIVINKKLLKVIKEKLRELWSPRQIASYLKINYNDRSMQVSSETIYSYIYIFLRRNLREEFTKQLRRGHKKKKSSRQECKRPKIRLKRYDKY